MKTATCTLVALSLATSTLAQSTALQCVKTCATSNPTSSFCDGDETGTALSNCTCQSLRNSALLQCIKTSCSQSDIATYANGLPQPCGSSLFPGLATGGSSSSSVAPTVTTTGTTVLTGTNGVPTSTGVITSTTTRPTTTAPPSGANAMVAPGLILAAGPLVAALL